MAVVESVTCLLFLSIVPFLIQTVACPHAEVIAIHAGTGRQAAIGVPLAMHSSDSDAYAHERHEYARKGKKQCYECSLGLISDVCLLV
jgi:hypothetical protein